MATGIKISKELNVIDAVISPLPLNLFVKPRDIYILTKNIDTQGTGGVTATAGVFQYFFWVLLQPFRGYPTYKQVAESAYNSSCLQTIGKSQTDMKELGKEF